MTKHWDGPPLEAWAAWSPQEAATRLAGVTAPWCVAGGWALDLWLGEQTRPHGDLEIAIQREDLPQIRAALGLPLHVAGDGEVRRLADDQTPPQHRHQNWVREGEAWRMDIMLEPGDAETWVYRRDPNLTAPRAWMVGVAGQVPYLKPQGVFISIGLDNADEGRRVFNAFAEGGKVVMPYDKTFWSPGFGMVTDRFGTPWMVNVLDPHTAP